MKRVIVSSFSLALGFGMAACSKSAPPPEAAPEHQAHAPAEGAEVSRATAELSPLGESNVRGQITFTTMGDGVHVEGRIEGLSPNTQHGFHVHENGDCSAPDGSSAGGHFNPGGHPHGAPADEASHAGDLGNVQADENGVATVSVHKSGAVLTGEHGYIGRGLIVHAKADDLTTQPTGDAGGRIACAVIQAAE